MNFAYIEKACQSVEDGKENQTYLYYSAKKVGVLHGSKYRVLQHAHFRVKSTAEDFRMNKNVVDEKYGRIIPLNVNRLVHGGCTEGEDGHEDCRRLHTKNKQRVL